MNAELVPQDQTAPRHKSVYNIPKWIVWVATLVSLVLLVLAITLPLTLKPKNESEQCSLDPHQSDSLVSRHDPFTSDPFDELEAENSGLNVGRLRSLWERLPSDERLGQLSMFTWGDIAGPGFPDNDESHWKDLIISGKVGAMYMMKALPQAKRFQQYAADADKIPLLYGYDVIHGYATIFPLNIGMAAAFDRLMIEDYAAIAAMEMLGDGMPWTMAPMLDIARDPRWGRMSESSGEDPYLTGELGARYVTGLQRNGVAACIKHLAAYGAAQAGRDYSTTDLSDATMFNDYLPGYKKAIQAGAMSGMASFNTIKGVPAHANRELLTDIIRGLWGFKGLMLSDYGAVRELTGHGVAVDLAQAANISLTSGIDMSMSDGAFLSGITQFSEHHAGFDQRLDNGRTLRDHVELAAKRVLVMKERLGLFDTKGILPEDGYGSKFHLKASLEAAQRAAEKSAVLLTNKNKALPIPSGTDKKILLVGMLADSAADQLGSWNAEGRNGSTKEKSLVKEAITPLAAFVKRFPDPSISESGDASKFVYKEGYTTTTWKEGYEERDKATMKEALEAVDTTIDYVIYYAGESMDQNGEGSSRTNLTMSLNQATLLHQIEAKLRKEELTAKLILVSQTGRPNILSWEDEYCDAILQFWAPGHMAGPALIRLLYGEVSPSGKLPVTFPRNVGQIPISYSDLHTGRPYYPVDNIDDGEQYVPSDGLRQINASPKYFSRYMDSKTSPLYVFGHGLSYTTFTYSASASPRTASASSNDTITIDVTVTNQDTSIAADEIVQIYVKTRVSKMAPHKKRLRQFERVSFKEGDGPQDIQFSLSVQEDFGYFNNTLNWVVEPGVYNIFVAKDSDDESHGFIVTLT